MERLEELTAAVKSGDTAKAHELLAAEPALANARDADGGSALMTAVYYGRAATVERILAAGAKLGLFEAAALGRVDDVRQMLEGAPSRIGEWSHDGFTPLQMACYFGQPDVVEWLLRRGADVSPASKNPMKVTALLAACAHHREAETERNVKLLLAAGADPNATMEGGYRALHSAAQNGFAGAVRRLLDAGADPEAKTDKGETAADLAAEHNHTATVDMLRTHVPAGK